MANECMDTVVYYAVSEDQEKGLIKFRDAVRRCYDTKMFAGGNSLSRMFEENGISVSGLSLRSSVVYSDLEGGHVTLECISAWSPPYEAYSRFAESFGIGFVLLNIKFILLKDRKIIHWMVFLTMPAETQIYILIQMRN